MPVKKKKSEKKKKLDITYGISEIKILSRHENDFNEYNLSQKDLLKNSESKIKIKLMINDKKETISYVIKSVCEYKKDDKVYNLFGVEVLYEFKIHDFKKTFHVTAKDIFDIPDRFMRSLIEMAVSGVRGIQAVSIMNPAYKPFTLPFVDLEKTLNHLKENSK